MANFKYIKGAGELLATFKAMRQKAPVAVAFANYGAAQIAMLEARNRAPVLEGWLRAGGYVEKPRATQGGTSSVEMGFGGAAEEYLVRQHETHASKAHFFSGALQDKQGEMNAFIHRYMQDFLLARQAALPAKRVPESPDEEKGPIKTSKHGRHG